MASKVTKPGTARLSEVAKHLVQPDGIVSTGWRDVESKCRHMGIEFDEWQRGAGRLALSKTADGKYAATVGGVGMSLPRQVGKTHLVGAMVFGLCILNPRMTVIWTAHHLSTAGETFIAMQGFAQRDKIQPYVANVYTGAGTWSVKFRNGSRILFGARERGYGRGFSGVDMLVFDEAGIFTDRALDNMLPTMNTAPNPLAFYMGTPPKPEDPSEVFQRMRTDALSGESDDVVWIECGADEDAKPDDRKQWSKANASFPHRTPVSAMLRLRKKLTDESWMREGLGIWDSMLRMFTAASWSQRCDENPDLCDPHPRIIAVDRSPTSKEWAIGGAQRVVSGDAHVEIGWAGQASPTAVAEKLVDIVREADPFAVVIDQRSPAAVLKPYLIEAGIEPVLTNGMQLALYCEGFYEAFLAHQISHSGQQILTDSVVTAVKRDIPGGRYAWGGTNINKVVAVSLAHGALLEFCKPPQRAPDPIADSPERSENSSFEREIDVMNVPF
jgi:hypothetical protein